MRGKERDQDVWRADWERRWKERTSKPRWEEEWQKETEQWICEMNSFDLSDPSDAETVKYVASIVWKPEETIQEFYDGLLSKNGVGSQRLRLLHRLLSAKLGHLLQKLERCKRGFKAVLGGVPARAF